MNLVVKCFNNELNVLSGNAFNGLLYDMVAILVFDTLQNIAFKLFDQGRLLIEKYMLQSLISALVKIHCSVIGFVLPFEPLDNHTFAGTKLQHDPPYAWLKWFCAFGCRVQRIFE